MIDTITFDGKKLNYDDDLDFMPLGDSRDRLDMVYPDGNYNVLESRRTFTMRYKALPPGINKCIGWCPDTEHNGIIYAVYNYYSPDGGTTVYHNHCIIRFKADNTFEDISYAKSQWNFQSDYPITKMFIVGTGDDSMLFMNDNYNPPRLVNIKNLEDEVYTELNDAEINLYKPAPINKPTVLPYCIPAVKRNNLLGKTFQFAYNYVYDTGQKSLLGHYSDLVFDYSEETVCGDVNSVVSSNEVSNVIIVGVERDFSCVEKIELFVRIGDVGSGKMGEWKLYDTIDMDDDTYTYYFYNDKNATASDLPTSSLSDDVPLKSGVAEFVDNRIIVGNNNADRDNVSLDMTLELQRSSLNANPSSIQYCTASPYYANTDIDIIYGGSWETVSINVIICKVSAITTTPIIESFENYYYLYRKLTTQNNEIIDFFVDAINDNTNYDITASSVSGGHPNLLRISNTHYPDPGYWVYTFTSPIFSKGVTIKENSRQQLAIAYYDNFNKEGRALVKESIEITPYSSSNYNGYYTNYIKYTINHAPPSWAVCYQFLWASNGISNHFTIPILVKAYFGDSSDIIEDGMFTRVDVQAALDRCYELNESANFNNFEIKKGDRARIIGYITDTQVTHISEYIDVPVLGIDEEGKVLLPSFHSFDEYAYWVASVPRPIYLFEFYRPSDTIEGEDLVYYEIGDVIPISEDTNGDLAHEATTVTGSGVTAQNQVIDSSTPAIGVINFGDTYRFYWHFGGRFVKVNESTYQLKPMFANIESTSASFMYPSRTPSIGRHNWPDEDEKNETKPSLIYSGVYRSGSLNYNDLNRFVNDRIYMDEINGAITGLVAKGSTLEVYQEKKVSSKYINAVTETLPDGTTQTVYSNKFLNDGSLSPFKLGCSHPMSLTTNVYATYFYDLLTSSWYRRSQDGLTNITFNDTPSNPKMKNYGVALSKIISTAKDNGDSYYVRGSWDPVKQMYLFTYINTQTTDDITIGYHEPTNSWLSFYTLYDEMYSSLNGNRFFGFNNGLMYEYHVSNTRVATGYVTIHFNKQPNIVKRFLGFELGAEKKWAPSTDGDIYIEETATGYSDDDSHEFFYPRMTSYLKEGHLKGKEGSWTANFLRNTLTKLGTARSAAQAALYLYNGLILKGKTLSMKLRNAYTTTNKLKYLSIKYDKSK